GTDRAGPCGRAGRPGRDQPDDPRRRGAGAPRRRRMIERVRGLGLEDGARALLVLLSVAAFARARPEPWGWLALLPVVAATSVRLVRVPPLVRSWVERVLWLLLGLV